MPPRDEAESTTASASVDDAAGDETLNELIEDSLSVLEAEYGISRGFASKSDAVLVMEGWNKILAFQTEFSEALFGRWRILVALEHLIEQQEQQQPRQPATSSASSPSPLTVESLHLKACDQVEIGTDPLAICLGTRLVHGRPLLIAMLDACVRGLCPHTQTVQREAYRPISEVLKTSPSGFWGMRRFALPATSEGTPEDYFCIYARCGFLPTHWVCFCRAFLWACSTHSPYAEEADLEDLDKPPMESAMAAFCSMVVAKGAIEGIRSLIKSFQTNVFRIVLPRFWNHVTNSSESSKITFIGETFYRQLLSNHEEILDFFKHTDMDSLALHFAQTLDLMVKRVNQIGMNGSSFRGVVDHLNEMHRRSGIPTWTYPIVGGQLLKTIRPFLEAEEERTRECDLHATADEMEEAFASVYVELMSMVSHAMIWEENLIAEASDFLDQVAVELNWSQDQLSRRMMEVKLEIESTGTYTHTSDELQIGARLAWRNSSKCIGRIAWNTLMVRDCRHIESPDEIFKDVEEHLRIATGGTNIQSVMSVYKPKAVNEMWGIRFWSSQFVRYAGYKNAETGEVWGDPANVGFTEYIVKNGFWEPPKTKTRHDVLPLLLKIPGVRKPYVYQLPKEFVHEVRIEHPDYPKIKEMGLRWAAVPAISNFNMNIGGVDYQCMPFNGWFVSVEVVRNLFERYKLAKEWAIAMGISTQTKRIYEQRAYVEMDVAVNYSFEKQGFTMVDMETVGKSFLVHCKRERDQGRECPGQWSWIGGLTGPTNVTWHHEMRDFYLAPQYEYCAAAHEVLEFPEEYRNAVKDGNAVDAEEVEVSNPNEIKVPRVLIVFGSETGTAEAAAFRLARKLKLCKPTVAALNEVAGLKVVKERGVSKLLALTSTFGAGKAPSNADVFAQTEISEGLLQEVDVAVLALGSTLYPDFCKAGVTLDSQLRKAGGKQMLPLKKVDDSIGSEAPIAEWLDLITRLVMPDNLKKILEAKAGNGQTTIRFELTWKEQDALQRPECAIAQLAFDPPGIEVKGEIERFAWPDEESSPLLGNEELIENGNIDSRSTRKITFEVPDGESYVSGDHLAVHPLNSMEMVRRFGACFADELVSACPLSPEIDRAKRIEHQLQQPFVVDCIEDGDRLAARLAFSTPETLSTSLQAFVDLKNASAIVSDFLQVIKKCLTAGAAPKDGAFGIRILENHGFSGDNADKCRRLTHLIKDIVDSKSDKTEKIEEFAQSFPTVVDFLESFQSILCTSGASKAQKDPLLSLADVLPLLPKLRPRYYSISSSDRLEPRKVSISVGVVHVETTKGVTIHGVCSNYLARLEPGKDRAKIAIRGSNFRGPKDVGSSMILVGAGTGLAPMMGFIQDRALDVAEFSGSQPIGEAHLFFGCRSNKERIYADVTDGWVTDAVLQQHLAMSREPGVPKKYVQQELHDTGAELCQLLLRDGTHYYICGDAKVGDECYEACVSVLRKYGEMSRVGAVAYIKRMRVENRWQFDLWGIINHFVEAKRQIKSARIDRSSTWLKSFE